MGIKKLDVIEEFPSQSGSLDILHFRNLPFTPTRMYWLSRVDSEQSRGGHAHKELSQVFIVMSGSLRVRFWDGLETIELFLKSGTAPVYVPPGYWRDLDNFSSDAILLVLADREFNEADYLRTRDEFLEWKRLS